MAKFTDIRPACKSSFTNYTVQPLKYCSVACQLANPIIEDSVEEFKIQEVKVAKSVKVCLTGENKMAYKNRLIQLLLLVISVIWSGCSENTVFKSFDMTESKYQNNKGVPSLIDNIKNTKEPETTPVEHYIDEEDMLKLSLEVYDGVIKNWEDVRKVVTLAYDVDTVYTGARNVVVPVFTKPTTVASSDPIFSLYNKITYEDYLKYRKEQAPVNSPAEKNIRALVELLKNSVNESSIGELSFKYYSNKELLFKLLPTLKPVATTTLCNIYDKNEVKGDFMYKNKRVILTGRVKKVRKNSDDTIITLDCPTSFFDVDVTLKAHQAFAVHSLNEGTSVFIVGVVEGKDILRYVAEEGYILKVSE